MTVQEAQVDDLHESDDEEFVDELTPGTQLMHGQYTIESFLNSGGFGITYLARDSLDRLVVIKECFPGSFCRRQNASVAARSRAHQAELRSIVRLFTQEARSLAKAGHPNIVGVHQVFEENGTAYMALDYVEGMDLLEIITETPGILTPEQVRSYLSKMLEAISFVHKQGILHRDISPDNILIRADGEPVLIDFGAAREQASKQSRLLSALRVVKEGYSPQEFYVAGSEQSPSCDLYSLAASFYHIITGELPPDSQTRLAAAAAGDEDPYVPLGKRTNDYDEVFCSSLDKAMAVLPRERIQSAEDWLAILKGDLPIAPAPERITNRPVSPKRVEKASAGKSKIPVLLGSVAVVGIAAAGYLASQGGLDDLTFEFPSSQGSLIGESTPQVTVPTPDTFTGPVFMQEPEALLQTVAVQDTVPAVPTPQSAVVTATTPTLPPADVEDLFAITSEMPATGEVAILPLDLESLPGSIELVVPGELQMGPEPVAPTQEAAATEPQDLSIASLPESIQPVVPTGPAATEVEQPATEIATLQATGVTGGFGHDPLPFTLSETDAGVVASADSGAPFWLEPGTRILTINEQPITTPNEAITIYESASASAGEDALQLAIATEAQISGAAIDRTLSLSPFYTTTLQNGLEFIARPEGGTWITIVTAAPQEAAFKVGDRVVAFMPTSERIENPETLRQIIERDLPTGRSNFSFAIQREGRLWVESFNLSN